MLLALKVRPEALPTGSPMSVLGNFCNVEVKSDTLTQMAKERSLAAGRAIRFLTGNYSVISKEGNNVLAQQRDSEWPEWAFVRGLFKSMGYSDYDLARPLVGIANSWNRAVPGHYNLNLVSDYVKQGIFQAGGTLSSSADRRL